MYMKMLLRTDGGKRIPDYRNYLCSVCLNWRKRWRNTGVGGLCFITRAMMAECAAKRIEVRIAEAVRMIRKIRKPLVLGRVKSRKA